VLTERMRRAMVDCSVLVTAGPGPAPRLEQAVATSNLNVPDLTLPFSLTGFPALVTCIGFSAENLPLSIQIVGRPFEEAKVLRVADAYQRHIPWHSRRPKL
jgi:aspartyl-tRNA(Asn)/glutamyl-tRNA(Gln) amidotransferase subunit A